MQLRTILYPTDFSEPAQEALRYAVDMAQESGARLIVLHAVETLGPENVTHGEAISQAQPAAYQQRLWNDLRQIQIPDPQLRIEFVLSEGDPVTTILRTAAERDCDLSAATAGMGCGAFSKGVWRSRSSAGQAVLSSW